MKKTIISIYISSIILVYSCGTTGHLKFYNFNNTKDSVMNDLLSVINYNSLYVAPPHWNNYEQGIDTIRDIYVYFQSNPKEIYQLGFKGDTAEWRLNKKSCTLALVGVFNGKTWAFEKDMKTKEIERVEKRFEMEILSKMKSKN
jgi:hypothetical protein